MIKEEEIKIPLEETTVIVQGKKKIIIHRHASGESKVIEAMQVVLGPGWHYVGDQEDGENGESKI